MRRQDVWIPGFGMAVVIAGLVALALLATAAAAWAQTTSAFAVTATVDGRCRIEATPIVFGTYDPVVDHALTGTDLDATGTVTIQCTKGTVASIGLDAGIHSAGAVGTTRAMQGPGEHLSYEIYQDGGHSVFWGNGGGDVLSLPAALNAAPQVFTTHGRIPRGQDVSSGNYTDTVTATVNF